MQRASGSPVVEKAEGVLLRLKVQPKSSRCGILGRQGDRIRVAVHSPPERGAANRELIQVLSRLLGSVRANLTLVAGEKSRNKDVMMRTALSADEVLSRLDQDSNTSTG